MFIQQWRTILTTTTLLFITFFAEGQVISKGDIQVNAGTGFAIHGISSDDPNLQNDAALSGLINLSGYYNLSEKWGLGILYERNGFATEEDSSEAARSSNLMLGALYRIKNGEKGSFDISLLFGPSYFEYERTDSGEKIRADGVTLQLGIGFKHYFGNTVGIFSDLLYSGYVYDKLEDEDDNVLQRSDGKGDVNIDFNGAHLRVGLALKF